MKVLLISGSRADHNALSMVHRALLKAGHKSGVVKWPNLMIANDPDVVALAGDRLEILRAALWATEERFPICHISGGDVTTGSADDRYRDAITALSCIHCPETMVAFARLTAMIKPGDWLKCTGNPALDMIAQTSIYSATETFDMVGIEYGDPNILVCVHPNTVGEDRFLDFTAVADALVKLPDGASIILIGANADPGGDEINQRWREMAATEPKRYIYRENLEPRLYYSLMAHCDAMVGNSSAMLTEAPLFGLPCVLVGDRQKGRPMADNVIIACATVSEVCIGVSEALRRGRWLPCRSPYGDGHSAPKVVEAMEGWWRSWVASQHCGMDSYSESASPALT